MHMVVGITFEQYPYQMYLLCAIRPIDFWKGDNFNIVYKL